MFVETELRLEYGSIVGLDLIATRGTEVVHLDGIVRWFDAHGIGLQFAPMGARETHALSVLIDHARHTLDGKSSPSPVLTSAS